MLHWRNCRFVQELDVFFSGDREFGLWVVNNKIISAGEHIRKIFLVPFRCQFVHCIRGTWNYDEFDLYILVPRFISCLKMRYTPPTICHGKQWGKQSSWPLQKSVVSWVGATLIWLDTSHIVGRIPVVSPLFVAETLWVTQYDCLNQGKKPYMYMYMYIYVYPSIANISKLK